MGHQMKLEFAINGLQVSHLLTKWKKVKQLFTLSNYKKVHSSFEFDTLNDKYS